MISQFDTKEIGRLFRVFKGLCAGPLNSNGRALAKEAFLEIPCIKVNPLKDRIGIGADAVGWQTIAHLLILNHSLPLNYV